MLISALPAAGSFMKKSGTGEGGSAANATRLARIAALGISSDQQNRSVTPSHKFRTACLTASKLMSE